MQKQLIMVFDALERAFIKAGDMAEELGNTPISRADFGKNLVALLGLSALPFVTRATNSTAISTYELLNLPHPDCTHRDDREELQDYLDLELRLCAGRREHGAYTKITPKEWAHDNMPTSVQDEFLQLQGVKLTKINNDIFQDMLYASYHRDVQSFTLLFDKLQVPAHRHFMVYVIFQKLFNTYMMKGLSAPATHTLTFEAFESMLTPGSSTYIAPASLYAYLQSLYEADNPNLPITQKDYYLPLPEVTGDDLPPPQQYKIKTKEGKILEHPTKVDRQTAEQNITVTGYGISCSRRGNDATAGVYAQDMTCLHGVSEDVLTYLAYLLGKLHDLANNEIAVKPYISGGTEPGHGGNSYFSHHPGSAGHLSGYAKTPSVTLSEASRDAIAKRHGSGNKIDISSKGVTGYLLSMYFGLRTEGRMTTRTETIAGKRYTVQVLYHKGHFDICVIPEHLYALTQ